MNNFVEQIERIESKLKLAKRVDRNLRVFGASHHKYKIGNAINESRIVIFEDKYKIQLPICYKAFLTKVGNGGSSYQNSAAGPFYGIYPLEENIDELIDYPEKYISGKVKIHPNMSDELWVDLIRNFKENEDMSDEEFDKEIGSLYAGILPIGSQGCTYLHGIILNGYHKGKVVNLDLSMQKPEFTFENNFLDWYERWLDEVISGELLKNEPNWFGYSKRVIPVITLNEIKERKQKRWYEIWKK
ncbi:SMI1/KNR4 family protein [Saprospiraceae bacterium]|nr:SMI1/KNR4 family protein [Saprospiraceae bacterium]